MSVCAGLQEADFNHIYLVCTVKEEELESLIVIMWGEKIFV